MPGLANDVTKIVYSGTSAGGEIWSTGHYCVSENAGGLPSIDALNALAGVCFAAFDDNAWAPQLGGISSGRKLTKCSVYFYPAGSLVSGAVGEHVEEASAGSSASTHPYQVGVVWSLRTPLNTRRGRGRMYLPYDGEPVIAGTGQYSVATATNVCTAAQNYFDAINALVTGFTTWEAVVVSWTAGLAHPITSVIVDTIPDIQRRRVNSLTPVGQALLPIS